MLEIKVKWSISKLYDEKYCEFWSFMTQIGNEQLIENRQSVTTEATLIELIDCTYSGEKHDDFDKGKNKLISIDLTSRLYITGHPTRQELWRGPI